MNIISILSSIILFLLENFNISCSIYVYTVKFLAEHSVCFQYWKMQFHHFLDCAVSGEKSAVMCLFALSYVMCLFALCFKTSFSHRFHTLVMMWLNLIFYVFILMRFSRVHLIVGL